MENRDALHAGCGLVAVMLLVLSHAALAPAQDYAKTQAGKKSGQSRAQQTGVTS